MAMKTNYRMELTEKQWQIIKNFIPKQKRCHVSFGAENQGKKADTLRWHPRQPVDGHHGSRR